MATNAWPSVRDDALGSVPDEQKETFDGDSDGAPERWYRPNVAYWSDVDKAIQDGVQKIIVDGRPVQSTLDGLHGQIQSAAKATGEPYPPAA